MRAGYRLVCPVRDPASASAMALRDLRADGVPRADAQRERPDQESNDDAPRIVAADLTRAGGLDHLGDSLSGGSAGVGPLFVVSCLASRSGGRHDSELVEYAANRVLLDWALARGAGHFTLLSAICVQKPRLAFQFAKLRFEEALAASGLSHSIVRPTAFFKSLSGQLDRVRSGRPFLFFGDGTSTACKPIAEGDLARFIRCTLEDASLRGILPIGGPGPALTPLDQARLLAGLTGQPLRTRSVPPGLLLGVARLLALGGRVSRSLADKAEFARIGHYYATESMLLWDADKKRYDAGATPEFGSITLADSYRAQLAGEECQDLGEHAVFAGRNDTAS